MDYYEAFRPAHLGYGGFTRVDWVWSLLAHLSVPAALFLAPGPMIAAAPLLFVATIGEHNRNVEEEALDAFNFAITLTALYALGQIALAVTEQFDLNPWPATILDALPYPVAVWSAFYAAKRIGLAGYDYPLGPRLVLPVEHWVPKPPKATDAKRLSRARQRASVLMRSSRVRFASRPPSHQ